MASKMYYGSIDLNKIDKNKIVSKDKNGNLFENGAKYYNIVVWVDEIPDNYGNQASIQESITKEERESGIKANYIGNLKTNEQPKPFQSTEKYSEISGQSEPEDDLLF
jgi:hypothetical protein